MAKILLHPRDFDNLEPMLLEEEGNTAADVSRSEKASSHPDQCHVNGRYGVPNFLIASPYTTQPHLLDLGSLNPIARNLAIALVDLQPSSPTYMLRPFSIAFNWEELFAVRLPELITSTDLSVDTSWPVGQTQFFHVVYFRSTLHEDANSKLLSQLDQESHAEAVTSGGLLKYWFGSPDEQRRNMATCIWRSREDAIHGGKGPWHREARQAAGQLYKEIEFRKLGLQLRRMDHNRIEWSFTDFDVRDSADVH